MSSSRKALNSETSRRPFSVTSLTAGDSASTALPISSETGLGLRLHAAFVFSITQISFPLNFSRPYPKIPRLEGSRASRYQAVTRNDLSTRKRVNSELVRCANSSVADLEKGGIDCRAGK